MDNYGLIASVVLYRKPPVDGKGFNLIGTRRKVQGERR